MIEPPEGARDTKESVDSAAMLAAVTIHLMEIIVHLRNALRILTRMSPSYKAITERYLCQRYPQISVNKLLQFTQLVPDPVQPNIHT